MRLLKEEEMKQTQNNLQSMSKKELQQELYRYMDMVCGLEREISYLQHCNNELEHTIKGYNMLINGITKYIVNGKP